MISSAPPSTAEQATESYQPNAEQLQRATSLRRFNRLAVFLPLGITAVLLLAAFGFLAWRAIVPSEAAFFSRLTISGIADLLVIMVLLPLMLLLAAITGGAIYGLVYWRQRTQERPPYERDRLRLLLWKLGNILDTIQARLLSYSDMATKPLIVANARVNQIATTISRLVRPAPSDQTRD